jgi:hypothetical protein
MNATTTPPVLPELDDARIAAMERTVFARIGAARTARRARRGRWWVAGSAAAGVVVVAAVLASWIGAQVAPRGAGSFDAAVMPGGAPEIATVPESARGEAESLSVESSAGAADAAAGGLREIISSASATVSVDDVSDTAERIGEDARERGGYVESVNVGSTGVTTDANGATVYPAPMPYAGEGWISVRVPAAELEAAMSDLDEVGEVTSSSVSSTDVTDQAVDLRARIAAAETSVARLTELMAQAQSTADLIAAETALQERQAMLESDRQQLAMLEGQVELASLSVQLVPPAEVVEADPAGFGDGVAAGWNGLVATLNGLVIAFGFLLPWLAVIAVVGAIVWGIARLVRRRRRTTPSEEG